MIKYFISYIRLLSLDVVLGACVSTMFVAQYLDVDVPWIVVTALGISVWVIYTFDHLLDGGKTGVKPSSPRHQFHQSNSKPLYAVLIVMTILGVVLVTQLPLEVIINGFWLVLAVAIYFGGLKIIGSKPSPYKEPLVAMAYAIGVFLGPMSLMNTDDYEQLIMLFTVYLMLALINLLVFSVYELDIDEADQHTSVARYFGVKKTNVIIASFFLLLIVLLTNQSMTLFDLNVVVLILMSTVLFAVHYLKKLFKQNEWYRVLGDSVFYFPVIALL